jgi:hypothetical protein
MLKSIVSFFHFVRDTWFSFGLKISQAVLSMLVIRYQIEGRNEDFVHLILLVGILLAASNFLDFGILTNILNTFYKENSKSNTYTEELFLGKKIFRKALPKFLIITFFNSLFIVMSITLIHGNNRVDIWNFIFLELIFILYSVSNYVNRIIIALSKIFLLIKLQTIGTIVQFIFIFLVSYYELSIYYAIFSFLLPNLFISGWIIYHLSKLPKQGNEGKTGLGQVRTSEVNLSWKLQLTQIIQYLIVSLLPLYLSVHLTTREFVEYLLTFRLYGLIINFFSVMTLKQWRIDAMINTDRDVRARIFYKLNFESAMQVVAAAFLSVMLTISLPIIWPFFIDNYEMPGIGVLISWVLYVMFQVLSSQIYLKIVAASDYSLVLRMTLQQFMVLICVGIVFNHSRSNGVMYLLIPAAGFVSVFFLERIPVIAKSYKK